MRTFVLLALLSSACSTNGLPATASKAAIAPTPVIVVVAECGNTSCPWTASTSASDVFVTKSLDEARAHFIFDADEFAAIEPQLPTNLRDLARHVSSSWTSGNVSVDLEVNAPDGEQLHLLAYSESL